MRPTDALVHPVEWTTTTVGKAVEIKRGISWSKDQEHAQPRDDRVPVIRIGNVQARLELDDLLYLSRLKPAAVKSKRVVAGWTVIVGSNGNRARVGNAVLVKHDSDFLFASFLIGAKPKGDSGLRPEYFYRWLSAEQVQAYLSASSEGTTGLNNLSHSFFRAMAISVPPPDEQTAIARILEAADTTLESIGAAIERAREVKRSLVQRVLTEGLRGESQRKTAIGLVPNSWHVIPVGDVVGSFQYGLSVPMDQNGKLPILRMGNIQDGEVVLSDLKYVSLPDKFVAPYALKRGDVLFNRTNSQEWVGKIGIYRHDAPSVFASYLIRLLPDEAKVDNYYLGHVLGSYSAQCRIKRYATPGVQQVNVNATNLGKVLIPLPVGEDGLREQRDIAALLECADTVVRSYEPMLIAQQALRASLMHDLLTGRVRVTNAIKAAAL
jgi:type I restriction enzyme S subunit